MNKQLNYAIIILLIIVMAGLSLMLVQNQKTITEQRATIATQQQKITELEGKVKELEAVTPAKILQQTGQLIKEKGVEILQQQLQK